MTKENNELTNEDALRHIKENLQTLLNDRNRNSVKLKHLYDSAIRLGYSENEATVMILNEVFDIAVLNAKPLQGSR